MYSLFLEKKMKREIVLALTAVISLSVMADEFVKNQSPRKAICESTSVTENKTSALDEETSGGRPKVSVQRRLPAGVRVPASRPDPFEDYRKGKPQYQSITVLKSSIPEIQEGSVFKSNTHGVKFYFNDYWLFLSKKAEYFSNEFGETMQKDLYQWEFSNYIEGSPRYSHRGGSNNRTTNFTTPEGITIQIVSFTCDPIPVNEPMSYPLRLTNDLYFIEFAAPQPYEYSKKEN